MTRKTFSLLACLLLCGSLFAAAAHAAPEPSLAQRSWQIKFTHGPLQSIMVRDVNGEPQWFWYITYKVTNTTGAEQLFVPDVSIATDDGKISNVSVDLPLRVFEAIKKQTANEFLLSPVQVMGKLLQGPDNEKESVIIWPTGSMEINKLNVFFAGLSGETQIVKSPSGGENKVLRKTLMIQFNLPGDPSNPQQATISQTGESWIMR